MFCTYSTLRSLLADHVAVLVPARKSAPRVRIDASHGLSKGTDSLQIDARINHS